MKFELAHSFSNNKSSENHSFIILYLMNSFWIEWLSKKSFSVWIYLLGGKYVGSFTNFFQCSFSCRFTKREYKNKTTIKHTLQFSLFMNKYNFNFFPCALHGTNSDEGLTELIDLYCVKSKWLTSVTGNYDF